MAGKRNHEQEGRKKLGELLSQVQDATGKATVLPIPSDAKVIAALNKLKQSLDFSHVPSNINILISNSEALYFENDDISNILKDNFQLKDLRISDRIEGVSDRIMSFTGSVEAVIPAVIFASFVLNAKLNNFVGSTQYTLKSSNYVLNLLVRRSNDTELMSKFANDTQVKAYDYSLSYGRSNSCSTIRVRGDFHALFKFLTKILPYCGNINNVKQLSVTGVYGNPNLIKRQAINQRVVELSLENVKKYIESQ